MKTNDLKIATGHTMSSNTSNAQSSGMDRKIEPRGTSKWVKGAGSLFLLSIAAYFLYHFAMQGRSLTVNGERQSIALVQSGLFEDYIPLRGQVVPLSTVYLDVVQGGRVEKVLIEDGVLITAGEQLVRLSNSDLQLSVMDTESRVMEQLNAMRDQELRLEQNRLGHKRSLVEIRYNILRLRRDLARQKELLKKKHISQAEYDAFVDELDYYEQKKAVTIESQASDEKMMRSQLTFFAEKNGIMEENLEFARRSLEDLNVSAPVAGRLSGFNLEVGQSISRGERIGQIDSPDQFKLKAVIDEYYLGRVSLDQTVNLEREGSSFQLTVAKIYPDVSNGRFEVDLVFGESAPKGIRRGQTLQAQLTLGNSTQALIIPNGNFFQDSGGRWVFVVNSSGTEAVKRSVTLGRRNKNFIEVVSGLEQGERVLVSSYSAFGDVERLTLNDS
ncbi:MAG: efflux RND transporter periplasmic adaptor subunit [Pseudomonadales bacterium]